MLLSWQFDKGSDRSSNQSTMLKALWMQCLCSMENIGYSGLWLHKVWNTVQGIVLYNMWTWVLKVDTTPVKYLPLQGVDCRACRGYGIYRVRKPTSDAANGCKSITGRNSTMYTKPYDIYQNWGGKPYNLYEFKVYLVFKEMFTWDGCNSSRLWSVARPIPVRSQRPVYSRQANRQSLQAKSTALDSVFTSMNCPSLSLRSWHSCVKHTSQACKPTTQLFWFAGHEQELSKPHCRSRTIVVSKTNTLASPAGIEHGCCSVFSSAQLTASRWQLLHSRLADGIGHFCIIFMKLSYINTFFV